MDTQPRLQVLQETLHEAYKVLCCADISWNSLCSDVTRSYVWGGLGFSLPYTAVHLMLQRTKTTASFKLCGNSLSVQTHMVVMFTCTHIFVQWSSVLSRFSVATSFARAWYGKLNDMFFYVSHKGTWRLKHCISVLNDKKNDTSKTFQKSIWC